MGSKDGTFDSVEPSGVDEQLVGAGRGVVEPGVCPGCDGDGAIFSPEWREWQNQVDEARHAWRADNPTGDWYASDDAHALLDAEPAGAEEYTCTDCEGTGRVSSSASVPVGGDIDHARLIAEALTGNPEPLRDEVHARLEVDPSNGESSARWDKDQPVADDQSVHDPGASHATTPFEGPATEPTPATREASTAIDNSDGEEAIGGDCPSLVDQARRAVLELKGRRALEEQYAHARSRDDQIATWRTHPSADASRSAAHGPVLSAFGD